MRTRLPTEPDRNWIIWILVALSTSLGLLLLVLTAPAPAYSSWALTLTARPQVAHDPVDNTLEVRVWPRGPQGPMRHWQIRCPGDQRCARLVRYRALLNREVAGPCPARSTSAREAYVVGRIRGRYVAAFLDQRDGCGVARWRALAHLLRHDDSRRGPG